MINLNDALPFSVKNGHRFESRVLTVGTLFFRFLETALSCCDYPLP